MQNTLAPPLDDLSAFVISGRVRGRLEEAPPYETSARTPAHAIQDAIDAERIGYRRVFLAERPDLKDVPTLLGGIGASTSRLGFASGIMAPGARHPMLTASIGATMQAAYGPRFSLGLGRGAPLYGHGGSGPMSFDGVADYCTIVKRIWAGERFDYSGPAGDFPNIGLNDRYEGPAPDVIAGIFALPRGARMVAETPAIDAVLVPAMLTPTGVSRARANLDEACERAGRDPKSVRLLMELVTAPNLSEEETRQIAHARAVTYLQPPAWGRAYEILNDWDPAVLQQLREHSQFAAVGDGLADLKFHRVQLSEPAKLVPDEWMHEACAIGSIEDCVAKLAEFRAAGVDEICTYGSTPLQNAGLVAAWRAHTNARTGEAVAS